jgi:hypothetical protein
MNASRPRLDPFAVSVGALALLTAAFFAAHAGGAVIMSSLSLGGVIAARAIGFSNRALVPVTIGLTVVLAAIWTEVLPLTGPQTSAFAHATGGVLVGWALAEYLRDRVRWPLWALGAIGAVFGLTILWEIGEYVGDQLFTTALIPSIHDSIDDIAFGTVGGTLGVVASFLSRRWNAAAG